jgi:hypothetical protein
MGPMKMRADRESRLTGWLHQLSEHLAAARNDLVAAQSRPGSVAHHISRASTELLERALAQLDQAGEIFLHCRRRWTAPRPPITARAAATALAS